MTKIILIYFFVLNALALGISRLFHTISEDGFILAFVFSCALLLPILYFERTKIYFAATSIILTTALVIELSHFYLFQGSLGPSTLFIIFDTNLAESQEFISDQLDWKLILLIIGTFALSFCVMKWVLNNFRYRFPFMIREPYKKQNNS